jgi:hypothetical protein
LDEQVSHPVNEALHPDDIPETSLLSSPFSADTHDRASTLHSGYTGPALHDSSKYGMKDSNAIGSNPGVVLVRLNLQIIITTDHLDNPGCRKRRSCITPIRSDRLFCHDICYLRTESIYTFNAGI